ncbi:arginine--tRNA ligase [Candidatus Gracilibacteria bacterium]|nr:arginine--tRNA ligase [Candidatus Gracilibacteria bacterium]
MNEIKSKLNNILINAIFTLYNIKIDEIKLENPPKKEFGDFCFAPFLISKEIKKSPNQISNELKDYLQNNDIFLEISVDGPYLNLKLSYIFYQDILTYFFIKQPNIGNGNKIVVDYIGANIGKPLHIGHMCTPNQGQVTCNLFRYLGYEVIGDSHLGDWGIIFGKLILAYTLWGEEEKLKDNAVNHLFELYIKITKESEVDVSLEDKIRETFLKLSSGDKNYIKLWQEFTSYSILAMQKELDRLNIEPTYHIGESFYEGLNLPKMGDYPDLKYSMTDIVKELLKLNIAQKNDDNSVGVIFLENSKIPSCMLAKRDGTHGYLASDLAAIKYRVDSFNPEKIIYHVDIRQELHFKQAFEISSNAKWIEKEKLIFAGNGFISLKTGTMSSRTGNIIRLKDLLDEAVNRAKKIIIQKNPDIGEKNLNDIGEIIGIGSIKYEYLSKSRNTDIVFDFDEFITFEGNSFPYVAYSYVRALKLIEKSGVELEILKNFKNINLDKKEQLEILKNIVALNETLILVGENMSYHNLISYIYNLSKDFSLFYNNVNILQEEDENKKLTNLKLIYLYKEVLDIVFKILAIKLPIKM